MPQYFLSITLSRNNYSEKSPIFSKMPSSAPNMGVRISYKDCKDVRLFKINTSLSLKIINANEIKANIGRSHLVHK